MKAVRVGRITVWFALLSSLLLCACTRQVDALQAATQAQTQFDFHSSLWMNLHHVLYEEALRRRPGRDGRPQQSLFGPTRFTPDELASWDAAVTYYDNEFIGAGRDLLLDDGMRQIAAVLTTQGNAVQLEATQLPAALREILQRAVPVYTKYWWPAHDAKNRQLVAELTGPLAKYGAHLQQELATTYRSNWPGGAQQRLRVDVVYYANWAGAYSFGAPDQIIIASADDERSAGWRRLELLFHEASHSLFGSLGTDLAAIAQRLGRAPEQLWHATLFFTTGEVVRRTLEQGGVGDYVPYAYYNGLFAADSDWSPYARALEKHWQPYLSGNKDYESALTGLVDAMPAQPGAQ